MEKIGESLTTLEIGFSYAKLGMTLTEAKLKYLDLIERTMNEKNE